MNSVITRSNDGIVLHCQTKPSVKIVKLMLIFNIAVKQHLLLLKLLITATAYVL